MVLTEHGIEILNMHDVSFVPPIQNKPDIPCPARMPVHFKNGSHKALPPKFPTTLRYGEQNSVLKVAETIEIDYVSRICSDSEQVHDGIIENSILRYNRLFESKSFVPDEFNFNRTSGLSFRGRNYISSSSYFNNR
jgi:hypothetical protein